MLRGKKRWHMGFELGKPNYLSPRSRIFEANKYSEQVARFRNLPSSSQEYFRSLLDMMDGEMLETAFGAHWRLELFEGYVTSADTGAEDVVRASRAALAAFCEDGKEHTDLVCKTLFEVATKNIENDRVLVPTMEVMSFLFDVQILQRTEVE